MMMTPLGGAVGTTLMGWAADSWGIATAFVVPCAGYVPVMLYAMAQLRKNELRGKAEIRNAGRVDRSDQPTMAFTAASSAEKGPEAPSLRVHIAAANFPASR